MCVSMIRNVISCKDIAAIKQRIRTFLGVMLVKKVAIYSQQGNHFKCKEENLEISPKTKGKNICAIDNISVTFTFNLVFIFFVDFTFLDIKRFLLSWNHYFLKSYIN